jgi:hypothetical protein
MAFNVTIDTLIAGGAEDRKKTKSVVSAARAYCDDLVGCNTPTHLRVGTAATFNATNQCSPPLLGYSRSMSGLIALPDVFTFTSGGPSTIIAQEMLAALNSYIADALAGFPATNHTAAPQATLAGLGVGSLPWVRRGGQWVKQDQNSNMVVQISVARVVPQVDPCSATIALRGGSSIQFSLKDEDCVPQLIAQFSNNVGIPGPDSDVLNEPAFGGGPGGILNAYAGSRLSNLEQSLLGLRTGDNCATVGTLASALVPAEYPIGTVVSIGET